MVSRVRRLSLLGAVLTLALAPGLAVAQSTAASAPAGDTSAVEAVVVTGTRLVGTFRAPTPVTSLSAEIITQRARATALEALYDLPAVRLDSGPGQSQRAGAAALTATTNLRGLGAGRTLTLVNGLRQVGAANGAFDTNRIPGNLIQRLDVVTGGASAAGSDAVAGVVNFIYNDNLKGLRAGVQYGVSQRGDNNQYLANFAYGADFAGGRGHFVIGSDFANVSGTGTQLSRKWGRNEWGLLTPTAAQRGAKVRFFREWLSSCVI